MRTGLVLLLLVSVALAVAAPVIVGGGVAWLLVAGATACAIVAGVGVMFVADRVLSAPVQARAGLDLVA